LQRTELATLGIAVDDERGPMGINDRCKCCFILSHHPVVLTIIGSGLGALLLLRIPLKALQITIAVAMIGVAVFSLLNKKSG
jgi:hypothetical protein